MFPTLLGRRKHVPGRAPSPRSRGSRLCLTTLEDRVVPYALAGSSWASLDVTYSLMPDGTQRVAGSSLTSSLFASMDSLAPREVWQAEIDQAMQAWADASGLTITRVADDGSPQGISGAAQGDTRFGDVRIGAYPRDNSVLGYTWYPSTSTRGGDIELNSAFPYQMGGGLASVVLHEAGHGLGLAHSTVDGAVMQAVSGSGGLHPDDVAGIQALYGPDSGVSTPPVVPPPPVNTAPTADRFEANESLGTAQNLGTVNSVNESGLTVHTSSDVDYFSFTPRRGGTYTITVSTANAGDLDLTAYNGQATLLATAATVTGNESITLSLGSGQTYSVRVYSPSGDLDSYDLAIAKVGGKPGKGGGYLRLDGPGVDATETRPGTAAASSGTTEQTRDQGSPAVEFLPAADGPVDRPGRPDSPGRAADAPGAIRSQALRLLMELDLPGRDWSEGPLWVRAG